MYKKKTELHLRIRHRPGPGSAENIDVIVHQKLVLGGTAPEPDAHAYI